MSEAKTNEWILETIDQLRKRRARPDLEKICHMVERKHGLSFEEIEANLNQLVSTGRVNAVVYKGSTSYRNAAKFRKKRQSFSNSPTFCSGNYDPAMLLTTVDTIVNGKREAVNEGEMQSTESIKDTVSIEEIEKYINQQPLQNTLIERNELLTALDKEVDIGTLNKLDSGEYKLSSFIKPHEMNTHANQWAPAPVKPGKPKSIAKSPSDKSAVLNSARIIISPGSGKRGRPPGRRKRIRKSQGAEFEPAGPKQPRRESMVTQDDSGQVALVVRCDFCLMTSDSNRKGEPEKLLVCKDCRAKAHPSCMNYSEELARRARYSPWQCIDCKTCYICEDSGDPDAMLFCDSCDKGYHMNCHRPPVSEKPGGNWVCSKCLLEDRQSEDGDSRSTEIETEIIKTEGPSCLPTPSDSPVSFQQEQKPKLENVSAALNGISAPIPLLAHTLKREVPDASEWSIDEVVRYVQDMGFPMEAQLFQEQEIDGKSLLLMKRCDILQGLSMKLGPALKIYAHVQRLQTKDEVIL